MPKNILRCMKCNGTGLVKRKNKFKCNNCYNDHTIKVCFLCENSNKGLYIECNSCYGCGEILK